MESQNLSPEEAFKRYLEEQKGQPINPAAAKAGKEELKTGEKAGFAVYSDEASKAEKVASYPTGHLNRVDVESAEIPKAIKDCEEAREKIIYWILNNIISSTNQVTVEKIEGKLMLELGNPDSRLDTETRDLYHEVLNTFRMLKKYKVISDEIEIADVPAFIKDAVQKLKIHK